MPATNVIPAEVTFEETLAFQGELFSMALDTDIAAGVSYKIGFTSPYNFCILHSRWRTAADRCRVRIYENIAYTGGTLTPPANRNRISSKLLSVVVHYGVTATVSNPILSGIFGLKAGSELEIDDLAIYKKNTPCIIELVNDAQSQTDAVNFFIACCELNLE